MKHIKSTSKIRRPKTACLSEISDVFSSLLGDKGK